MANRNENREHISHNINHKRGKGKRRRKRKRKIILVVEVLVLLILVGALFVWNKVGMIDWDKIEHVPTNEFSAETEAILSGYTTVALFGVDNRVVGNYKTGNSDSIIIAAINNDSKEVRLMSVYRDTLLDIGNGSRQKCNAAYSRGGPTQAMEMLNKNLDLDIQEYIAVDFNAVVKAVDAVGGVEIDVTEAEAPVLNSYIPEIIKVTGREANLVNPGMQTLNGVQAMAYCRIRYTAGDDFRRAERQRTVLSLLVDKVKKANVKEVNDTIDAVFPDISTSLSLADCLGLASGMLDYEISNSIGWPMGQRTADIGAKGSVDVPCTLATNVSKAHEILYDDIGYAPTETVNEISAAIENETGFHESDALDYITWHNE